MPEMMEKVRKIRKKKPLLDIQVDGGLNLETIHIAAEAGANCIVAGAIFRTSDPKEMIAKMREAVEERIRRGFGDEGDSGSLGGTEDTDC
jgi:ribulose-phosphate 3-epimerase